MIFRGRSQHAAATAAPDGDQGFAEAGGAVATRKGFAEIEDLTGRNRARRDPALERRILELRHRVGVQLTHAPPADPEPPTPASELVPNGPGVPEVAAAELTAELLRGAILRDGCLLVRGLIDNAESSRLVEGMTCAFEAREAARASGEPGHGPYYEEFVPDPEYEVASHRIMVSDPASLWGVDSPRVMFDLFETFERTGFRNTAANYLGERPAISINKCTLRRISPDGFTDDGPSFWHQDGAFLGDVRALNIWLSLSRCGDVAPGLDVVARRMDHIVPTGTEGAAFDWSVSQAVVEQEVGDSAIKRPIFEPGDALLFDDLLLHATAFEPEMSSTRYAVECWFFGPSAFPSDYAPLAS